MENKQNLPQSEILAAEKMTGYDVLDKNQHDVGSVTAIWTDNAGQPAFIGVRTFWLVGRTHVVPGYTAEVNHPRKHIRIPFTDEDVKSAPTFDPDADLSMDDERKILDYYRAHGTGLPEFKPGAQAPAVTKQKMGEERIETAPPPVYTERGKAEEEVEAKQRTEAAPRFTEREKPEEQIKAEDRIKSEERMEAERRVEVPPRFTEQEKSKEQIKAEERLEAEPHAEAQDVNIPLHEEELKVGTRRVEAGGVRLHKVVRTETVQQPVSLRREEIQVEHLPVSESRMKEEEKVFENEDIYIPLYREEPVSEKTTHVTGEFHAHKLEQTEQQTVSGEIRKEDVEVEKQQRKD